MALVIDGAHAPGQTDLALDQMGVDFYTGNAHKWLSSSRGAAFLYARPERQDLIEPLIVSHGWSRRKPDSSQFLDYLSWTGTTDPSAYLSVPAAIDFQAQNDWPAVQAACHNLLLEAQHRILELSDQEPLSPDSMWVQMCTIPLPGPISAYQELWDKYRIVVPLIDWQGRAFVRVSIQAYNSPADIDRLLTALEECISHR